MWDLNFVSMQLIKETVHPKQNLVIVETHSNGFFVPQNLNSFIFVS